MPETSPWGMVIHWPNEHLIDVLHRGGVQWIRVGTAWNPDLNRYEWGSADLLVSYAVRRGMSVYLGLDPMAPADRWKGFVTEAINRYHPRVTHFHIGNEPNDLRFFPPGKEVYVQRLEAAVKAVKEHPRGNQVKVCGPELAIGAPDPFPHIHNRAFFKRCLEAARNAGRPLDVASLHGYTGTGKEPSTLLNALQPYRDIARAFDPNLPLWLTETGFTSTGTTSGNGAHLKWLAARIGNQPDQWLRKVFFFVWSEHESPDPASPQGKYKWLDRALNPLPGLWPAYQEVIPETFPPVTPDYDAELQVVSMPEAVKPGVQRRGTITATNRGGKDWAAGTVALVFLDPGSLETATSQPIPGAVPRGASYTFAFDFVALGVAPEVLDCRWELRNQNLPFGFARRARVSIRLQERTPPTP